MSLYSGIMGLPAHQYHTKETAVHKIDRAGTSVVGSGTAIQIMTPLRNHIDGNNATTGEDDRHPGQGESDDSDYETGVQRNSTGYNGIVLIVLVP